MLSCFLQQVLFFANVNVMNIVADVMRSTMHMVLLQASTGQLEVIPLQDISDFVSVQVYTSWGLTHHVIAA